MKRNLKKLVTLLLAVCMTIGLLPMNMEVQAAEKTVVYRVIDDMDGTEKPLEGARIWVETSSGELIAESESGELVLSCSGMDEMETLTISVAWPAGYQSLLGDKTVTIEEMVLNLGDRNWYSSYVEDSIYATPAEIQLKVGEEFDLGGAYDLTKTEFALYCKKENGSSERVVSDCEWGSYEEGRDIYTTPYYDNMVNRNIIRAVKPGIATLQFTYHGMDCDVKLIVTEAENPDVKKQRCQVYYDGKILDGAELKASFPGEDGTILASSDTGKLEVAVDTKKNAGKFLEIQMKLPEGYEFWDGSGNTRSAGVYVDNISGIWDVRAYATKPAVDGRLTANISSVQLEVGESFDFSGALDTQQDGFQLLHVATDGTEKRVQGSIIGWSADRADTIKISYEDNTVTGLEDGHATLNFKSGNTYFNLPITVGNPTTAPEPPVGPTPPTEPIGVKTNEVSVNYYNAVTENWEKLNGAEITVSVGETVMGHTTTGQLSVTCDIDAHWGELLKVKIVLPEGYYEQGTGRKVIEEYWELQSFFEYPYQCSAQTIEEAAEGLVDNATLTVMHNGNVMKEAEVKAWYYPSDYDWNIPNLSTRELLATSQDGVLRLTRGDKLFGTIMYEMTIPDGYEILGQAFFTDDTGKYTRFNNIGDIFYEDGLYSFADKVVCVNNPATDKKYTHTFKITDMNNQTVENAYIGASNSFYKTQSADYIFGAIELMQDSTTISYYDWSNNYPDGKGGILVAIEAPEGYDVLNDCDIPNWRYDKLYNPDWTEKFYSYDELKDGGTTILKVGPEWQGTRFGVSQDTFVVEQGETIDLRGLALGQYNGVTEWYIAPDGTKRRVLSGLEPDVDLDKIEANGLIKFGNKETLDALLITASKTKTGTQDLTIYNRFSEDKCVIHITVKAPSAPDTPKNEIASEGEENVTVSGSDEILPKGTRFIVSKLSNGSDYEKVIEIARKKAEKLAGCAVFTMDLLDTNNEYIHQLNGYVEVTMPIPEEIHLGKGKTLVVYRVEDDETLTKCEAFVENGMITFRTNHFSTYIIGEETVEETSPKTGEAESNVQLFATPAFVIEESVFKTSKKKRNRR